MICEHIFSITFLKDLRPFLLSGKCLHLFLSSTNTFIYYKSFVFTPLNVLLFNTNNSIKHQLFLYAQLNDQTVLFQTIQFSINQQSQMLQVMLWITNNSIKHQLFLYTQLNDQTVLF